MFFPSSPFFVLFTFILYWYRLPSNVESESSVELARKVIVLSCLCSRGIKNGSSHCRDDSLVIPSQAASCLLSSLWPFFSHPGVGLEMPFGMPTEEGCLLLPEVLRGG